MFSLPCDRDQMQSFIQKYDKNQEHLEELAAMDDLLSGRFTESLSAYSIV